MASVVDGFGDIPLEPCFCHRRNAVADFFDDPDSLTFVSKLKDLVPEKDFVIPLRLSKCSA